MTIDPKEGSLDLAAEFIANFTAGLSQAGQMRVGDRIAAVPNKNHRRDAGDRGIGTLFEYTAGSGKTQIVLKGEMHAEQDNQLSFGLNFRAGSIEEFAAILEAASKGITAMHELAVSDNWAAFDPPTMTSMSGPAVTATAEEEKEVTLANIKAVANDSPGSVGTVDKMIVTEVLTGSLRIGANDEDAEEFDAEDNCTIDATNKAYWTSAPAASGATNMFKVKAGDSEGWVQTTAAVTVQATVS